MHLPFNLAGLLPAPLKFLNQKNSSISENLIRSSIETYDIGQSHFVVGLERVMNSSSPLSGSIHHLSCNPAAYYAAMDRDASGRRLHRTTPKPLHFLLDVMRYGDYLYSRAGTQASIWGVVRDDAIWVPGSGFYDEIDTQARLGRHAGADLSMRILDKQIAAYNAYLTRQVYRVSVRQKILTNHAKTYREIHRVDGCYGLDVAKSTMEHTVSNIWPLLNN